MKIYLYNGKANIIGSRIRQARKALKISQDMLSARLQIQGIELNSVYTRSCQNGVPNSDAPNLNSSKE